MILRAIRKAIRIGTKLKMQKLILMLFAMTSAIALDAQGVRTVQNNEAEVPLNWWYIIRN